MRITKIIFLLVLFYHSPSFAIRYSEKLCDDTTKYSCHTVKRGETWEKLFPQEQARDIAMRVNRMGIQLRKGMRIAIPHDIETANHLDYSPLANQISPRGVKTIFVTLKDLAWGAYDPQGNLVKWGPISSARGYCPDIGKRCSTVTGNFSVYRKHGAGCKSTKFPVPRGGAPMPYCMFFHGGFALHGSNEVVGYNASHGCVRMIVKDAKWLNEEFINDEKHVPVIVRNI